MTPSNSQSHALGLSHLASQEELTTIEPYGVVMCLRILLVENELSISPAELVTKLARVLNSQKN